MKGFVYKKIPQLRQWLIGLLTFSFPFALWGQSVDSLILAYTDKNGKVNIDSLLPIGKSFLYSTPDKAFRLAQQLVDLSKKQKELLKLAHSYRFLGAYYADVKNDWDSAYIYYKEAETLYRPLGWKKGEGAILHNYGAIKTFQGDYMESVSLYTEALRILNEAGDIETVHKTLNNLSTLYAFLKDFKKSEIYATECIAASRRIGDELMIATGSLALIDALLSQNKTEGVMAMFDEVLALAEKNNNAFQMIGYYFNYGKYHAYQTRDYEKAIAYYKKSLDLASKLPNPWYVASTQTILAHAYYENGQFNEAHIMAEAAIVGSEQLQAKDLVERALIVLARSDAHKLDFKNAFNHLDAAYKLRDTIFKEENQQRLALLEMEYQTEKKELKIAALEKQRKLYILLGIAGAVILLIALAFAFIRYRLAVSKRKLAEEETQRLEQEKQLVAVQATLDGETAERTRLAKDLHDGLGSMLSLVKFNLPQVKGEAAVLETIDVSRFQKAIGMLDDSIQELRRVAHHMMPESLLRYGLKASLTDFCTAIPIADFHYFGDETRLSEKLEIMIYRCIHELVNNALKHAQANHINVQLVQEDDRISFTVQDDGIGFDQEQVIEGMGLQNVRQRVNAFQGKMNVYSSEQGTEIHVELEFSKQDEND